MKNRKTEPRLDTPNCFGAPRRGSSEKRIWRIKLSAFGGRRCRERGSIGLLELPFIGLPEFVPEVGVGDLDEGPGPLAKGPPPELGDAVLGDHVVGLEPGEGHRPAGVKLLHDAGGLAAHGGGGHGDDGLAPLGEGGPPDEVHKAPRRR